MRARAPRHSRKPTNNLDRSPRPPALLRSQRAHEPAQHLTARPVHDRVEMHGQRRGEDLTCDLRLGRASRMSQQTRVVRLHRGRAIDPQPPASRIPISVVCSPCSNGKPMPRSVARHRAATSSAARISPPISNCDDTPRRYSAPAAFATSLAGCADAVPGGRRTPGQRPPTDRQVARTRRPYALIPSAPCRSAGPPSPRWGRQTPAFSRKGGSLDRRQHHARSGRPAERQPARDP